MRERTERLTWALAVVLCAVAAVLWQAAVPTAASIGSSPISISASTGEPAESLGARVGRVISNNPFRLSRAPSRTPFGTEPHPPIAPRFELPQLSLRGLVGPPWRAVLDGMPGIEAGRLVSPGDTIQGVRVISIRSDAVVLRNSDTSWTLHLRRP